MKDSKEMVGFDDMYNFLKRGYRHDRFEGRNGSVWGEDYSRIITQTHLNYIAECGHGCISMHDSCTGVAVYYDSMLNVIESPYTAKN